jgi:hypothetical protein
MVMWVGLQPDDVRQTESRSVNRRLEAADSSADPRATRDPRAAATEDPEGANPDRMNVKDDAHTRTLPMGPDGDHAAGTRVQHRMRAARRAARRSAPVASAKARGRAVRSSTSRKESPLARYEHVQRQVTDARYLGDYKVYLEFNDGRKGVVDLSDELYGDEMTPLRDRDRFSQVYLDVGLATLAWLDGQDFAPEFLYERLKAMN